MAESKVTRGWKKVSNEEPHNLYSPPYIIKTKLEYRASCKGEISIVYRILVENVEVKTTCMA
jgi:hypothetical protein